MARKKKEPRDKGIGTGRPRGRPVKVTPKIPDTFDNVIKALVKPVKDGEKEAS